MLFYFLLLFTVTKDISHPLTQFRLFQPWMSIMIIGFGIQTGLFFLIRKGYPISVFHKRQSATSTRAGATVSGMSMVACCAHHLVDVIPIIGFSGAMLFLTEYQKEFIIAGVATNLFGILYMIWIANNKIALKGNPTL